MREQHPMRYNRMTEILKVVASVKLSNTFLLKSYFLKVISPLTHYLWFYFYSETTANVNCNLPIQYYSCWICCFCSRTIIWNMYGIRRPVHSISFEIIVRRSLITVRFPEMIITEYSEGGPQIFTIFGIFVKLFNIMKIVIMIS